IRIPADSGLRGAYATFQIDPLIIVPGSNPTSHVGNGDCCPQISAFTVLTGSVTATASIPSTVVGDDGGEFAAGTTIDLTAGQSLVLSKGGDIAWMNTDSGNVEIVQTLLIGAYDGGTADTP